MCSLVDGVQESKSHLSPDFLFHFFIEQFHFTPLEDELFPKYLLTFSTDNKTNIFAVKL